MRRVAPARPAGDRTRERIVHAAAPGCARAPPVTPPASSPRPTILVVEDLPTLLGVVVEILTDAGFVVHAEHDPRQALTHVLTTPPDLILTDLMMPHLDGRALLARLRH